MSKDFLERLNPNTRSKLIQASQISTDKLALPSIGITRALDGGIYYRSQTMLWGNKSGGKSSMALGAVANAQRAGKDCVWIDAEGSYRPGWATRLGVDEESLHVLSSRAIHHTLDYGMDALRAGVDVLVLDSITPLLPQSYFSDKDEIRGLDGMNKIGSFSQDVGKMLNSFLYANESTALILISQARNTFGSMHASLIPSGGKATEHLNTVSIKLFSSNAEAEQIRGDVHVGDLIFDQKIGRKVNWLIDKDRGPGMMMDGTINLYFKGEHVGFDTAGEILDIGVKYGKVEKGGAWYTVYGERFQGAPKATAYIRDNPDVQERLWKDILSV